MNISKKKIIKIIYRILNNKVSELNKILNRVLKIIKEWLVS